MTNETTENLIARLSAEATPVRRLRPPLLRAGLWLVATTVISAGIIAAAADLPIFMERARDPRQRVELTATLATGLLAILAAFELSLPDRSRAWAWLPLPALTVWLTASGLGCMENWISGASYDFAESAECFLILIGISLPLGIALCWMLMRAKPIAPASVTAIGGLGVAAMAAFLLQFFHPFDVTIMDLAIHAVAVLIVIAVSALSGRTGAQA